MECPICLEELVDTENIYRHNSCTEEGVSERCIQCIKPMHAQCMMTYIYTNLQRGTIRCPSCHQTNSTYYFITDIASQIHEPVFTERHTIVRNASRRGLAEYTPRRIVTSIIESGVNELRRRRVLVLEQIRHTEIFLRSLPRTTMFGVEVPTTYFAGLGMMAFLLYHRNHSAASSEEIQRHLRDVLRGGGKNSKSNLHVIEKEILSTQDIDNLNDTLQKEKGLLYCVIIVDETDETKELMRKVKRSKDFELVEINNKEIQKRIQKTPFQRRRSVIPSRRTRMLRTPRMVRSRRTGTRRSRY